MHTCFHGQHLSAQFQDLTNVKKSLQRKLLGLEVKKKREEKGKGFFFSPGEEEDNLEVVLQRAPPHCCV